MQPKEIVKLLGKPVRDSYGRYLGSMVGFCVNPLGEVASVGVDEGPRGFEEIVTDRFRLEEEGIVVLPDWAVESQGTGKNLARFRRRISALEDLAKEMGIPATKLNEMVRKNNEGAQAVLEAYKALADRMAARGAEIEKQTEALDDFLLNMTVQFKAGELDESVFKMAGELYQAAKLRNIREAEDLARTLKMMAGTEDTEDAKQQTSEPATVLQVAPSPRPMFGQQMEAPGSKQLISEMP